MTIIVTGGAGFIGSNFIFHMLEKYPEYRIICLDKLTYAGNLSTLEIVMDNPEELVKDQGKWLDNIQKETNRMTKLVDDLLTLLDST